MVRKIVSLGRTDLDRAALDVALELGTPCGGWCPKGRRAEEGPNPTDLPSGRPPKRKAVRSRKNGEDY